VQMLVAGPDYADLKLSLGLGVAFVDFLHRQIYDFAPDCMLFTPDGLPWHRRLEDTVLGLGKPRLIYLAQTPRGFPFGPLQERHGKLPPAVLQAPHVHVLCLSQYLADYAHQHAGLKSRVFHPPVYGAPPFPTGGPRELVTLINPCPDKGVAILLALAQRMPDVAFAVVPTWGPPSPELAAAQKLPNVTTLESSEDVNDIYRRTRVLLVPSLWGEAFGFVVVEAMARGIPVLASDVGGLPEAKLGTRYILPVRPMTLRKVDNRLVHDIPAQDAGPWESALKELLGGPKVYARESSLAAKAAQDFIGSLSLAPVLELMPA
jgi:glycosyltransferase involved in cell wall biosynthesis